MQKLITEGKSYSPGDAQILRRQFYDEHFGIRDYNGPEGEHPFALVLMAEKEDHVTGGPLERLLKDFATYNIGEIFKISLSEYLDLPVSYIETIKKICFERVSANNEGIGQATSALNQARIDLHKTMRNSN